MTNYEYTIPLMVFLVAYAVFEVPSNYFFKRIQAKSLDRLLEVCMGCLHDWAWSSTQLSDCDGCPLSAQHVRGELIHWSYFLPHLWVQDERTLYAGRRCPCLSNPGRRLWGRNRVRRWPYENYSRSCCLALAVHSRGYTLLPSFCSGMVYPTRLPGRNILALNFRVQTCSRSPRARGLQRPRVIPKLGNCESDNPRHAFLGPLHHQLRHIGALQLPLALHADITAGLCYEALQAQLMTVPPYAVAYVISIIAA